MAVNVESGDEGSSGKVVSVRGSSQPFSLGFGQQSLLLMEGYNATEVTIEDAGVSSQGMAGVKAGGKQALLPDTRASAGSQHQRQYEPTVRWPRTGQGWQTAAGRTATEPSILSLGPSGRFSLQSEHKESSLWLLSKQDPALSDVST